MRYHKSSTFQSARSVIVKVIIYDGCLPLRGHLKASLLAKGGEGIVHVQLTSLGRGPQRAEA